MSTQPLQLAIILGSTREGRFGPVVANWFTNEAHRHESLTVDLIDLAEAGLPAQLGNQQPQAVTQLARRLDRADAFVIVTPEYNHSFPGTLKNAIDWFFDEWRAKPIGFVSYGGMGGGLRAVEQLRQVFAELHATTVRNTVSFHKVHNQFNGDGTPKDSKAAAAATTAMLNQLLWWGTALREARARVAYTG